MEDEVAQIWKQVEERVVRMAGGDPSQMKGLGDVEAVLLHLEKAQSSDKNTRETHKKVKDVFNGTLSCIQTIGEVVANTASFVFPPANLCYQALAMVIQAWQGCEGVFEDLALLLTQCREFLERLTYYMKTRMDAKLTRVACQHLSFFVEICDRALVLRKKHSRIKIMMKQLFLKDEEIQNALAEMRRLNAKEMGLVTAQTFSLTHETVANTKDNLNLTQKANTKLDSLVDDKNQQRRNKEMQRWKETILKALEFDQSMMERGAEGHVDDWEKAWQNHKKKIFPGTGEWIAEDPLFRSWIGGSDSSRPILGVEGRNGAGKTLVASNIIMHLRKLRGTESLTSRSVVAYYFLEPKHKAVADKDDVANLVSKSLLWQLAKADRPYLKSVFGICEKAEFFRNSSDTWNQLLFDNEDRSNMDSTFFIVIDGLAENVDALTETFKMISTSPNRHRTRLLLTGQESLFDHLSKEGVDIGRIKLGKSNLQDIAIYINTRMDQMETLKDRKNPDVSEVRAKIMKALKESTDGDYYKLGQDLDNLEEFDEVEEIEAYLDNIGKTRLEHISTLIQKLNRERTPKEIAEINEIILWLTYGLEELKVPEMEAALAFRTGKFVSRSLGSLESRIRTRYPIFCIDEEEGFVRYDAGDISGIIPAKKKKGISNEDGHDGANGIVPTEINMIRHYLNTVCPPDVYAKFSFDQFFEMKMARKNNHICSDPDNAHITLALRCLHCLTGQRTSKTEKLHGYAKANLYGHLDASDLSLSDRDLKSEVGPLLVKLFTDDYCSDSLLQPLWDDPPETIEFTTAMLPLSWCSWVLCEDGVNVIDKWLNDSAVLEKIKDVAWVKTFKSPEANRHRILLEVACRRAATRLFREQTTKRQIIFEFLFLSGALNKATTNRPEKADDTAYSDLFHPAIDTVHQVEEWSQKCLGTIDKDARWEAQAAVLLLHLSNEEDTQITKKHAEARARQACQLDRGDWSATHTLALTTESLVESVGLLKTLVERLTEDSEWLKEPDHRVALAEIMLDLGDRFWESSKKPDQAVAMYLRSLDFGRAESLIVRYRGILAKYAEQKLWAPIISFFEKILTVAPDEESNIAGKLVIPEKDGDVEVLVTVVLAPTFRATGRWELLDALYEKGFVACTNYWTWYLVRFDYGWLSNFREGGEDIAMPIWEELLLQVDKPSEAYVRSSAVNFISSQALPSFIKRAFPKRGDDAEAEPVREYCDKIDTFYKGFGTLASQSTDACILYARYFYLRGDTAQAKRLTKETVVQCLEMLSDDELENDNVSFWDLSRVFSVVEDFPNAHVAWEMMARTRQPVVEQWLKEKAERDLKKATEELTTHHTAKADLGDVEDGGKNEKDTEQEKSPDEEALQADADPEDTRSNDSAEAEEEPPWGWVFCDGCDHSFLFPSEAWTCLDEGGTLQLHEECFRKLQEGTLENKACDKNHHHYHIGKRDEERLAQVPKGSVLLGEQIMTLEAWKREIKASYVDSIINSAAAQGALV